MHPPQVENPSQVIRVFPPSGQAGIGAILAGCYQGVEDLAQHRVVKVAGSEMGISVVTLLTAICSVPPSLGPPPERHHSTSTAVIKLISPFLPIRLILYRFLY